MGKEKTALQKAAKKNGVLVNEIRKEIEMALATAMQSPDPNVQAYWKSIPHKGTKPTPEEVIRYIVKQTKRK